MEVERGGGSAGNEPHREAGTRFGKYTLLCKLATGGMGELYVARQTGAGGFEKLVVVKRLLPHLAEDAHFVAMLLDEARIAARLSHPNVCQVYDLGQADGHYYIAMEHLEGVPASLILRRARRAGQRLEVGMATAILHQAALGLHHAHELTDGGGKSMGLVHRDVSPSNLFVTASGLVKVLDFGVAKSQDALARTHTGALKGKYAYMSPEQVVGDAVDRRSDVFSLGIVLFELLTAQRLFWRDSEYKMFQAIVEEPIPRIHDVRAGAPAPVAAVAERALSRDPRKRFESAQAMAEALEEAAQDAGGLWKQARVAGYVDQYFGPLMDERRQDVQNGLAVAERARDARVTPPVSGQPSGSIEIDLGDDAAGGQPDVARNPAGAGAARRRGPMTWRWLILGGAVAAAAVGGSALAYHLWSGRNEAAPPPVVLLGGEVETPDGRIARPAGTGALAGGHPAASSTAADAGAATVDQDDAGPGPSRSGDRAHRAKDPYSARLSRYQGRIRGCFNQHATSVAGTPHVALALRIDDAGRVVHAGLMPPSLEATDLGACVLAVARQVTFGAQDQEVEVTIPLKVRRRH